MINLPLRKLRYPVKNKTKLESEVTLYCMYNGLRNFSDLRQSLLVGKLLIYTGIDYQNSYSQTQKLYKVIIIKNL